MGRQTRVDLPVQLLLSILFDPVVQYYQCRPETQLVLSTRLLPDFLQLQMVLVDQGSQLVQ